MLFIKCNKLKIDTYFLTNEKQVFKKNIYQHNMNVFLKKEYSIQLNHSLNEDQSETKRKAFNSLNEHV